MLDSKEYVIDASQLFALCDERGWSNRDIADMCGLSESIVSLVRSGRRDPGGRFIRQVAGNLAQHDLAFKDLFNIVDVVDAPPLYD